MSKCLGCMEEQQSNEPVCPQCGYVAGTAAREAYHLTPGTILHERYKVGRVLGYGGFGVTYIGYDTSLERKVAIKEYLPGELATRHPGQTMVSIFDGERREQFEMGLERFVKEARHLAKFSTTEGIVHIYDSFMESNTAYIVMEYLQGQTLKNFLSEKGGKLPPDEAIKIVLPLLGALKQVHVEGIIHRDISPDNIFMTNSGEVKLIDFGAARFASTQQSKSLSVILKPGYAPEEQYRSRGKQGPWTDMYAVGATLYRMITGLIPEEALERAAKDDLKTPSELGIKIDSSAEIAIMNALNIKAEHRIQSAGEFEEALLGTIELQRVVVKPQKQDSGRWPVWLKTVVMTSAAAAAVLIILILTGFIQILPGDKINILGTDSGMVMIPGLVNLKVEEGQSKLQDAGLELLIVDKQTSFKVNTDKIMTQNPAEGRRVEPGSKIEVVVSAGPEMALVPDVEYRLLETAKAILESRGFAVKVEEVFSTDDAAGVVISQSIDADTKFEKGRSVKIVVSKGPETAVTPKSVSMPNLVGLTFSEARAKLVELGLYTLRGEDAYSDTVIKNQVFVQNVTAGLPVMTGSIVTIGVSMGVEQTVVPDVQYKTADEAISLLTAAKLGYTRVYETSDSVKAGNVIRQGTEAYTVVNVGTQIEVVVSGAKPTAIPIVTPIPTAIITVATATPTPTPQQTTVAPLTPTTSTPLPTPLPTLTTPSIVETGTTLP